MTTTAVIGSENVIVIASSGWMQHKSQLYSGGGTFYLLMESAAGVRDIFLGGRDGEMEREGGH